MKLTSTKITKALSKLADAKAFAQECIISVQIACSHKNLAERPSSPPIRVCLNCGMTEDGWGCGFIILRHEGDLGLPTILTSTLRNLSTGLHIEEEDKGPLLRHEKNIEAID